MFPQVSVYIKIFKSTFKALKDFSVWFIALGLWFTFIFYLFSVVLGGNLNFITFAEAVNSMFLVTFGFMDYDSFYNDNIGYGYWALIVIILFWMLVILMVLFAQNIILAIVASAYDQEAEKAQSIPHRSFVGLILQRVQHAIFWFIEKRTNGGKAWWLHDKPFIHFNISALGRSDWELTKSKWKLLTHPLMDSIMVYFSGGQIVDWSFHSDDKEWLWDSGACIQEAFENGIKPWQSENDEIPGVDAFLDIPLNQDQLSAVLKSICRCKMLQSTTVGLCSKKNIVADIDEVSPRMPDGHTWDGDALLSRFSEVAFGLFKSLKKNNVAELKKKSKASTMFAKTRNIAQSVQDISSDVESIKKDMKIIMSKLSFVEFDDSRRSTSVRRPSRDI